MMNRVGVAHNSVGYEACQSQAFTRSAGLINLQAADLKFANFAGTNLQEANLSEANLQAADLSEANLTKAYRRLVCS